VVYHVGSIPAAPITLAAVASPTSVFPGDPVSVTSTPGNLNPKLHDLYAWTGSGVTGNGTQAAVNTSALAPGTYTVKVQLKEGKPGKEALGRSAEASATFTVKEFEPPTATCSANPSTLRPGETAAVTAMGISPQNRPLTYSYSATAGSISGNGASAVFASNGAPTGVTGITCNVSDDKGHSATANTSVTIAAPYVLPIPHTQTLCSIAFEKDKRRPVRVDNEAKACLDEVALDLGKQPDAKAVLVGSSDAVEKAKTAKEAKFALKHKHAKVDDLAAQRAVNAKDYLVTEKGIDASRIGVATNATDGKAVADYLVPSGATFASDVQATTPVDQASVKPQARKPLASKPAHRKHVAAAASTK
jgi:outer membrane protein OmpA-like peptidoglycan-associated protein